MTRSYTPNARRIHLSELMIAGVHGGAQQPSGITMSLAGSELSKIVSSCSVSLTDSKVSALTIRLYDPKSKWLFATGSGYFPLDGVVTWTPAGAGVTHYFLITAREVVSEYETEITCVARATEWARRTIGPLSATGLTIDRAFLYLIGAPDGTVSVPIVEPHAAPGTLTVNAADGNADAEDLWKAVERWNDENKTGMRLIERGASGIFALGRTSYLLPVMPTLDVDVADLDVGFLGVESARESLNADNQAKSLETVNGEDGRGPQRTLTLRVHIDLGKKLWPGMVVNIKSLGSMSGRYWVSAVSGDLDDGSEWTVDLVTPAPDPVYTEGVTGAEGGYEGGSGPSGWLTAEDIARLLRSIGWPEDSLETAVALALTESGGGNPKARNDRNNNPPGSVDRGLWQFNSYWRKDVEDKCAYDPVCASKEALRTYLAKGFSQWSAFNNGSYKKYLPAARLGILAAAKPKTVDTTKPTIVPVGSVAALKLAILNSPNVNFSTARHREDWASGGVGANGQKVQISDDLVRIVYQLQLTHKILITSAITTHSNQVKGTERESPHKSGRGCDISTIDGIHVANSGAGKLIYEQVVREISNYPASYRPSQLSVPQSSSIGSTLNGVEIFRNSGHNDHLHITTSRAG